MRITKILLALMLASSLTAAAQTQDAETQYGAQTYQELKQKGVIVASSPLYDVLKPIALAITKVAGPQYEYPIHFYIVHSKQPNAFAAPGGNVYVVDSLFYFVKNREELAGTLCHETSHLIHHDSMKQIAHEEEIRRRQIAAELLLGPSIRTILLASVLGDLDSMHFSRGDEERADLKGADTCAAAGLNPWGLVWLMQDFQNADLDSPPEVLSDHPNDEHRIEQLQLHFQQNPARFGRFASNRKRAAALRLPKNPAEKLVTPAPTSDDNG